MLVTSEGVVRIRLGSHDFASCVRIMENPSSVLEKENLNIGDTEASFRVPKTSTERSREWRERRKLIKRNVNVGDINNTTVQAENILKPKTKKQETILFEEPLIEIDMQPTEEVDPLFVDPEDESEIEVSVDEAQNDIGFNIFKFPHSELKPPEKSISPSITEPEGVKVKEEVDGSGVYIKEEPHESLKENENPLSAYGLAQALTTVKYLCPRCHFRSTIKEEVNIHVLSHRTLISRPRPCDKCLFVAKTIRELTQHKKLYHPRGGSTNLTMLPTGEFKCPHCVFTTFHRSNLRTHIKIHTTDVIYSCDKCPYSAISKLNMENHAVRHLHTNQKRWKFKCPHCGLLEKTKISLSRHLILHGEGEMLTCTLCPYKSPYMHTISQHSKMCHGVKYNKKKSQEMSWKYKRTGRKRKKYQNNNDSELKLSPVVRRGRKRKNIEENNLSNELLQTISDENKRGTTKCMKEIDMSTTVINNKTDDATITKKENCDTVVSETPANEINDSVNTDIVRNEIINTDIARNEVRDQEYIEQESSRLRKLLEEKHTSKSPIYKSHNFPNEKISSDKETSECESDNQTDCGFEDRTSSSQSELTNDRLNEVSCEESNSNLINHEDTSTCNEGDLNDNSECQTAKEDSTFSSQIPGNNHSEIKELGSVSVNENKSLTDVNPKQINKPNEEISKLVNASEDSRTNIPEVLVLKREGNSFACFKKLNKQLPLKD